MKGQAKWDKVTNKVGRKPQKAVWQGSQERLIFHNRDMFHGLKMQLQLKDELFHQ